MPRWIMGHKKNMIAPTTIYTRVEIMGRDISVVASHECCEAPYVRAIIPSEAKVDTSSDEVRFALKPHKVFIFGKDSEERIYFEV